MDDKMKWFIIKCIEQHRGDDLYRAQLAFQGFSPEKMQQEWGQSGQTCQQILNEYQQREEKCDKAIKAIKNLKKI